MAQKNGFIINNNVLVEYIGNDEDINIPDGVIDVGPSAFKNNSNLKRVCFSNSVDVISPEAFYGCDNLEYVDLSNSVTLIRAWAFSECPNLHTVIGIDNLKQINMGAFCGCQSLKNFKLPKNLRIGEDCFAGCYDLCDNSGMMIYNGVLFSCSRDLKELTVPDTVSFISNFAFQDHPNLTKVIINSNIQDIPLDAFKNCVALEEIVLPETVATINDDAFSGCKNLKKIVLPKNIKEIGNRAFFKCKSLKDFNLPGSIFQIGTEAFAGCKNLSADCKERVSRINPEACVIKPNFYRQFANSFTFFVFGSKLDDKNLLEKIIDKAYIDATNQGAFNTLIGEDETEKRVAADNIRIKAKEFLLGKIKEYEKPKGESYSVWHSDVCDGLKSFYDKEPLINNKENELFSYGNAQKWVNMTVKYLLLIKEINRSYINFVTESVAKIISAIYTDIEFLHMPIDSYIIDALWKESDIKYFPEKEGTNLRRDYPYKTPSDYVKSWSTWNKEEYDKLKKEYFSFFEENDIIPIIWEMDAWMKQAAERHK